jgi:ankyrin repeat protein
MEVLDAKLQQAVNAGDATECQALVAIGADVNQVDDAGWSLMMRASYLGKLRICEILLAAGASDGYTSALGDTALLLASEEENFDVCRMLIRAGDHLDKLDAFGQTALMKLASKGSTDLCELLINAGANMHTLGDNGCTAFSMAIAKDMLGPCKLLLERGADPCARFDLYGNPTPFQLAVLSGSAKIVEYFLSELGEDAAQRTADGKTMLQLGRKSATVKQLIKSAKTVSSVSHAIAGNPEGLILEPQSFPRSSGPSPL